MSAQNLPDANKKKFSGDVLLCEDCVFSTKLVKQDLISLGINVTTCQNGQEAVDILTKHPNSFDLVIMNIIMPVMNGLEAAQTLKWRGVAVPMASFSSSTEPSDLEVYQSYGMGYHLKKPYTKEEFEACLSKYLKAV